jgi:hypothetical protein
MEMLIVGTPIVIVQDSPNGRFSAFFEDEGKTGYFYAVDPAQADRIVDAVHIYNVGNVVDRSKPSQVKIAWTDDGMKCVLLINDYPHAVFDFSAKRGYCRTNFPNFSSDGGGWSKADHSWSDEAIAWLNLSDCT